MCGNGALRDRLSVRRARWVKVRLGPGSRRRPRGSWPGGEEGKEHVNFSFYRYTGNRVPFLALCVGIFLDEIENGTRKLDVYRLQSDTVQMLDRRCKSLSG